MKRLLVYLLLVGAVGCGESEPANETPWDEVRSQAKQSSPSELAEQPSENDQTSQGEPSDPVAALKKLGVHFLVPNEQGEPTQFTAAFNEGIDDAKLAYLEDMHHLEHILLQATDVSDAGLVHLKGLTSLKTLWLNKTRVTDVGLVHLKGLTNLEILQLPQSSKITDKGLMHLAGLTNLANLDLGGTSITDAGLVHLKGLNKLEMLALPKNITDAGVAELQKALPDCKITH